MPASTCSALEHEVDAWLGPESISLEELLRRVAGADAVLTLLTERSTARSSTPPARS